ncbi:MAG: HNH endonuclease [Chloroflexi bacterium]|nr:HNH endonuclease [Chloroflexota bacterium]
MAENGGDYTLQEWEDLCAIYDNRCLCCGRGDLLLTVDHIIPLIDGGSNNISNIQPLCKSCNSSKHIKHTDYHQRWVDMTGGEPELVNN